MKRTSQHMVVCYRCKAQIPKDQFEQHRCPQEPVVPKVEPSPEELAAVRDPHDYDAAPPVHTNGRNDKPKPAEAHRMLPASPDAEQGLLASCLLLPRDVIPEAKSRGVCSQWFHVPAHATIWKTLAEMDDANELIDLITVTQKLSDKHLLDKVGGAAFLAQLFTFLPTGANAGYYADITERKHQLREIIRVCSQHANRAYDEQDNLNGILSEIHSDVTALVLGKSRKADKSIKEIAGEVITRMSDRLAGNIRYVQTGIPRLDHDSPIRAGDFVVIAGRRKSGKSALAGEIIAHACIREKQAAAVFSLEMPDWQWAERLIANLGKISLRSISTGKLTEGEHQRLHPTIKDLAESKLHLFDAVHDLAGIVAKMRQVKAQHEDMRLAVVDYCQLVEVPERKGSNREQEVSKVSRTLKLLAGELGIGIIGLSQLNAEGETRESRALEQDCTALWKVLEELDKHNQPISGKENERTLWVPFQRNGPPNIRIRMNFIGAQSRFEEDHSSPQEHEEPETSRKPYYD